MQNNNVDEIELKDILEEIMDQEFDTICDDNSTQEISVCLIKYLNLLKAGNHQQAQSELSSLPPCQVWIRPGNQIKMVQDPDSSDDDEEDMKNAGEPMEDEDESEEEEEGWTKVKSTRRKK